MGCSFWESFFCYFCVFVCFGCRCVFVIGVYFVGVFGEEWVGEVIGVKWYEWKYLEKELIFSFLCNKFKLNFFIMN